MGRGIPYLCACTRHIIILCAVRVNSTKIKKIVVRVPVDWQSTSSAVQVVHGRTCSCCSWREEIVETWQTRVSPIIVLSHYFVFFFHLFSAFPRFQRPDVFVSFPITRRPPSSRPRPSATGKPARAIMYIPCTHKIRLSLYNARPDARKKESMVFALLLLLLFGMRARVF